MKFAEQEKNLKTFCRHPSDLAVIEYVTPYKICVAIFLHEFVYLKSPKFRSEIQENEMSENEEKFINSIQFDSIQRKDFCRLLLKLMQNVDLEFEEIADKILNREEII